MENAVSEAVDLLVLTGDIVDRRNQVFEAWGPFEAGVAELGSEGIPLVMVEGNHDAGILSDVVESMNMDHCHLIGRDGTWERWTLEKNGSPALHLDGWSYPRKKVRKNPIDDYDLSSAKEPTVGLLHTELGGTDSPYAPVAEPDLRNTPVDAWLLGHIHKPEKRSGTPPVLYPGSPQPLNPSETGVHGSWLVEISPSGSFDFTQNAVSTLQYETIELNTATLSNLEQLPERIKSRLADSIDKRASNSNPLELILTRLVLSGRTDLFSTLEERRTSVREKLNIMEEGIDIRILGVDNRTRPSLNLEQLGTEKSPVGRLAQLLLTLENEPVEALPNELLRDVDRVVNEAYESSTYEPLRIHGPDGSLEQEEQLEILARQGRRFLDRLLRQKGESS